MQSPKVSIIMPLFNAAAYVRDAIESILAQLFDDFELLVVDDGSTDSGPDFVRAISDHRVRLISGNTNAGPAAARNRGLAAARGRYIAFFDSDDIALPEMLADAMDSAATGYEIVSCWYEGIDATGRLTQQDFKEVIYPERLSPIMLFRNCIGTSGLLIKRECINGHTFDESLPVASDYDLWARLLPGRMATQLPRVLVRYRSHSGNITQRKATMAADCMRRIFGTQLARLGVQASAAEVDLHARLGSLTYGTPMETVLAAEQWLLKLEAANGVSRVYPIGPFREILGEQWYSVCHSACGHGMWTLHEFYESPLAEWISPSAKQRYDLLRLTARGALKNLLPRRDTPDASSQP